MSLFYYYFSLFTNLDFVLYHSFFSNVNTLSFNFSTKPTSFSIDYSLSFSCLNQHSFSKLHWLFWQILTISGCKVFLCFINSDFSENVSSQIMHLNVSLFLEWRNQIFSLQMDIHNYCNFCNNQFSLYALSFYGSSCKIFLQNLQKIVLFSSFSISVQICPYKSYMSSAS